MKASLLQAIEGYVFVLSAMAAVCHSAHGVYQRCPVRFSKVCECHYHAPPISGQNTVVAQMQKHMEQINQKLDKLNLNIKACTAPKVAKSCKDILDRQRRGRLSDGVYTIHVGGRNMKVYCDMTKDGGGWTLITATRTSYGWTTTTVYERNANRPSLNHDYSILGQADNIKSNANGNTFTYRIEANGRGRWGGVWKAPNSYSFTSTGDGQTNVNLIKKFDSWNYGATSIEKRMPWISVHDINTLLTTNKKGDPHWWGTLMMKTTTAAVNRQRYNLGPWIYPKVVRANEIYYWLREN